MTFKPKPIKVNMKVTGAKEVLAAIKKNSEWVRGSLAAAIYQEGTEIDRKSVRLVPVDTGRLRATHFVSLPFDKINPKVILGYGTNYAIYVHERSDLKHRAPTQYKFLEQPFREAKAGYKARLGKRTWALYKRGVKTAIATGTPTQPQDKGEEFQKTKRTTITAKSKRRITALKGKSK